MDIEEFMTIMLQRNSEGLTKWQITEAPTAKPTEPPHWKAFKVATHLCGCYTAVWLYYVVVMLQCDYIVLWLHCGVSTVDSRNINVHRHDVLQCTLVAITRN